MKNSITCCIIASLVFGMSGAANAADIGDVIKYVSPTAFVASKIAENVDAEDVRKAADVVMTVTNPVYATAKGTVAAAKVVAENVDAEDVRKAADVVMTVTNPVYATVKGTVATAKVVAENADATDLALGMVSPALAAGSIATKAVAKHVAGDADAGAKGAAAGVTGTTEAGATQQQPAKKTASQPAKKTASQPAKKAASQPAKKTTKNPAKKSAQKAPAKPAPVVNEAEVACKAAGANFVNGACQCPDVQGYPRVYNNGKCDYRADVTACMNLSPNATWNVVSGRCECTQAGYVFDGAQCIESEDGKKARLDAEKAKIKAAHDAINALSESKKTVWRNEDGKFNTARLASDSVAGVVLGATGALVTNKLVKDKHVEDGFEDLNCVIGNDVVAGWGDSVVIGF